MAELAACPDVLHLQRTTAFGYYDANFVVAVQRRTDHLGADARRGVVPAADLAHPAQQVVLATGAHERPLVFADNDRPGIMLARRPAPT